jgi:hypothetical protein
MLAKLPPSKKMNGRHFLGTILSRIMGMQDNSLRRASDGWEVLEARRDHRHGEE